MKVLQVIPTLCAGGAEGFISNLSVQLVGLGAEVRCFLMGGVRGERGQVLCSRLRGAGIEVVGTEEHNIRAPMNLVRLVGLIRSWRPDIVQANLRSAELLVAAAKVLSVGSNACYVRRLANTKLTRSCSTRGVRMMDRFFRLTIACSPAVSDAYRNSMREAHRSQLVTVPNGGLLLDSVPSVKQKRDARRQLDIADEAFVVAHIGSMTPGGRSNASLKSGQKAQDVLIKAFAQAFRADHDCLLVLVGDGPQRPKVEELAKGIGVVEQTRFLGQLPLPWPALKAADMFCFPSRHEGLPNVLPEAASCGLPVVASDIPEIRDLCPGDAWLLRPVDDVGAFADAMRTIRANSELFTGHARDAVDGFRKRFSMTTCAEQYLQAYERALGGNKKN